MELVDKVYYSHFAFELANYLCTKILLSFCKEPLHFQFLVTVASVVALKTKKVQNRLFRQKSPFSWSWSQPISQTGRKTTYFPRVRGVELKNLELVEWSYFFFGVGVLLNRS
jgi:hypothetical protein